MGCFCYCYYYCYDLLLCFKVCPWISTLAFFLYQNIVSAVIWGNWNSVHLKRHLREWRLKEKEILLKIRKSSVWHALHCINILKWCFFMYVLNSPKMEQVWTCRLFRISLGNIMQSSGLFQNFTFLKLTLKE